MTDEERELLEILKGASKKKSVFDESGEDDGPDPDPEPPKKGAAAKKPNTAKPGKREDKPAFVGVQHALFARSVK